MEMDMIWSAILTLGIAFVGFVLRGYILELQRLQILINKTREEYVTKPDNNTAMDRVIARLDALDLKMDRMLDR
jgi:hypothetical protein|tara:strand:+ start:72 stop:293 length:222 start_codon:yes stop_codon:yes gene_type:complete